MFTDATATQTNMLALIAKCHAPSSASAGVVVEMSVVEMSSTVIFSSVVVIATVIFSSVVVDAISASAIVVVTVVYVTTAVTVLLEMPADVSTLPASLMASVIVESPDEIRLLAAEAT